MSRKRFPKKNQNNFFVISIAKILNYKYSLLFPNLFYGIDRLVIVQNFRYKKRSETQSRLCSNF